jgi:hypothetical protein
VAVVAAAVQRDVWKVEEEEELESFWKYFQFSSREERSTH